MLLPLPVPLPYASNCTLVAWAKSLVVLLGGIPVAPINVLVFCCAETPATKLIACWPKVLSYATVFSHSHSKLLFMFCRYDALAIAAEGYWHLPGHLPVERTIRRNF